MRYVTYGATGSLMEAAFTTVVAVAGSRRPAVRGPSTPWMAPIYGLAMPLFEPVHDRVRHRPAWQRATVYAVGILAVEAATGWTLRRVTGSCPWDYSGRSPFSVAGLIRLDYAPLWGLAGLGAELVHDRLTGRDGRATGYPANGEAGRPRTDGRWRNNPPAYGWALRPSGGRSVHAVVM